MELPWKDLDFKAAWEEWIEYRRERRLPKYVPKGLQKTLSMLKNISDGKKETAIKIIIKSMEQNYQGLFPLSPIDDPKKKEPLKSDFKKVPKDNPEPVKVDLSEMAMQDWYNETAKQVKANKLNLEFIPASVADWLEKKDKLTHEPYLKEAAIRIGKKLAADLSKKEEYINYKAMYRKGAFEKPWAGKIERLSKCMALHDYILKNE